MVTTKERDELSIVDPTFGMSMMEDPVNLFFNINVKNPAGALKKRMRLVAISLENAGHYSPCVESSRRWDVTLNADRKLTIRP
jgi:hypothetical protein